MDDKLRWNIRNLRKKNLGLVRVIEENGLDFFLVISIVDDFFKRVIRNIRKKF